MVATTWREGVACGIQLVEAEDAAAIHSFYNQRAGPTARTVQPKMSAIVRLKTVI